MATGDSARVILPRYELARQGRVFTGSIAAAGVVLPIYSNNTQQCGLWNPAGSGKDLVLLRVTMTYVDTTGAAGGYVLGQLTGLGSAVATGTNITAFTETTPVNEYPGVSGNAVASVAKFGQGATLTVVGSAVTIRRHLGLNQLVTTAADATTVPWRADIDFDGDLVIPPGVAIFLAGNIATLSKWAGSLTWAEVERTS